MEKKTSAKERFYLIKHRLKQYHACKVNMIFDEKSKWNQMLVAPVVLPQGVSQNQSNFNIKGLERKRLLFTPEEISFELKRVGADNTLSFYELCRRLELAQSPQQAYQLLHTYLESEPFSKIGWYHKGLAAFFSGNVHQAINCFDFALTIDADYIPPRLFKADLLFSMGLYSQSVEIYRELKQPFEDHAEVFCSIGICYEKMKQYDSALDYYKKAIRSNQNCSDAWFGKGVIESYCHNVTEGIENIQTAIELDQINPDYWFTLGLIYLNQKEYSKARRAFNQVLKIVPTDWQATFNLANCWFLSGDMAKTRQVFLQTIRKKHNVAAAHFCLSSLYWLAGNEIEALLHFEQGWLVDPTTAHEAEFYYPDLLQQNAMKLIICKHAS